MPDVGVCTVSLNAWISASVIGHTRVLIGARAAGGSVQ